MSKIKIKMNGAGCRALMTSKEIIGVLEAQADAKLAGLPKGYAKNVYPNGKSRANVSIYTDTQSAMRDNARNNTLLQAFGGGLRIRKRGK